MAGRRTKGYRISSTGRGPVELKKSQYAIFYFNFGAKTVPFFTKIKINGIFIHNS